MDRAGSQHGGQSLLVKVRAIGSCHIYCGSGWEHSADIDEHHVFDLERPSDHVEEQLATAWSVGDGDAARDAADQMVEWALECGADPCDGLARSGDPHARWRPPSCRGRRGMSSYVDDGLTAEISYGAPVRDDWPDAHPYTVTLRYQQPAMTGPVLHRAGLAP